MNRREHLERLERRREVLEELRRRARGPIPQAFARGQLRELLQHVAACEACVSPDEAEAHVDLIERGELLPSPRRSRPK